MSSCGTGLFPTPDPINPDLNASALTAVGGFGGIYVQWTLAEGTLAGMSHTQIYRGMSNDFGLAVPLHRIKGDHYFDTISDGNPEDTYYYWIRHYDTANQAGNLIGPASASFIQPVTDIIEDLAGQIDQSHLSSGLNFRLNEITTIDDTLTQEIIDRTDAVNLLTTALDTASGDFENVRTALIDEVSARETADSAQVETINGLGVRVDDAEASILDLQVASAGGYCEIGGVPDATHATQSACEDAGGTWKGTAVLAASVNTLNSSVGDLENDLSTLDGEVDTRIDASIASIDYTGIVGHCEIGGVPNGSYTSQSACTGAGGTWVTTTALAASVDNYIVSNNDAVAALELTATAHNDDIGDLKTEYFMKTSVTAPNGQQLVGGFGVVNDGITIDAGFDVDRFWVGRSDANGVKPFYVSGSDVLINSAYIGELTADKITSGTISVPVNGQITIGAGSSGITNLADAGALATQDTVDWNSDVLNKPTTLAALDAAAAAQLDGKITMFYQSGTPSSPSTGDYWTDTGDNNKVKRYSGSGWVDVSDDRIVDAIDAANNAKTTADGKAQVFFEGANPYLSANVGDLWYTPSGDLKRFQGGSTWVTVSDVTSQNTSADTNEVNGVAAATVATGAQRANTGLNSSGQVTQIIKGANLPTTGMATGLNLTYEYMGYYNGGWKTFIKNDGTFYFDGNGSNYIDWNGSTLKVRGDIQASSLSISYGGYSSIAINPAGELIKVYGQNGYSNNQSLFSVAGSTAYGAICNIGSSSSNRQGIKVSNSTSSSARGIEVSGGGTAFYTSGSDLGFQYSSSGSGKGLDISTYSGRAIDVYSQTGIAVKGTTASGNAGHFTGGGSSPACYVINTDDGNAVHADADSGVAVYGGSSSYVGVWGETSGSTYGLAGFGTSSGGGGVQGIGRVNGGYFKSNYSGGTGVDAEANGSGGVGGRFHGVGNSVILTGGPAVTFTGAHEALLPNDETYEIGDIVVVTQIANKSNINDIIPYVERCLIADSKAVYGVVSSVDDMPEYGIKDGMPILMGGLMGISETEYNDYKANNKRVVCNGLGEGQINVCDANGDIEVGDFISSSIVPGKGQLYTGNDMRVVVAKALEPVDWATESETTKMIACVYLCS